MRLDAIGALTVLFVYPSIGGIGPELIDQWTAIPGARGCTPEACDFRDRMTAFREAGAEVIGLSGQPPAEQRAAAENLQLPYRLLSDEELTLRESPGLPSFEFGGRDFFRRITLIVAGSEIEDVLYPVFPPQDAARQALDRLRARAGGP